MKLSVIIPQYKEDDKIVKRLLTSIDYQIGVDWNLIEVIIVNDASNTILSEDMLNSFENFKPRYIKLEKNIGVGLCRQKGIDEAKGEYLTFCDADDYFYTYGVFATFFAEMQNSPDMILTNWLEEIVIEGKKQYVEHGMNATWMHGRMIRKDFLKAHNIRFSKELTYHEDSYLLSIISPLAQKSRIVPIMSYVWSWADNSITRNNNGEYSYKSFEEFVKAKRLALEWLKEYKYPNMGVMVMEVLIYIYYCFYENTEWDEKYILASEKECFEIIDSFLDEIKSCTEQEIFELLKVRMGLVQKPILIDESILQFIERIHTKHK